MTNFDMLKLLLTSYNSKECVIWPFMLDKDGYGRLYYPSTKNNVSAYRIAYMLTKGPIPSGLCVRHSCDNRQCVNPFHLETGTNADNVADRVSRNRSATGVDNGNAKLSEDDVKKIFLSKEKAITLARLYGIDRKSVYKIRNGLSWIEVTRAL